MKNCSDVSILFQAFINELWLTKMKERKENKMKIFVAEFLNCTKGQENFEGSFAIHK